MRSSQSDADGFIMVVLLIVMGITAVWMAADLPAWKQQATREKEAELVFRGTQYVRALRLYQQRNGPQTAPPDLDALVTGKFLRRKYKDPITNDDFEPVMNSTAPTVPGQAAPGGPTPGRAGSTPAQPQSGRAATPVAQTPANQAGRAGSAGNAGQAFGGTIAGVRSKSSAASIMQYLGATHYNEWQFIYVATAAGAGQQGGGAGRGGAGAPGQPAGPGGFTPLGPGRGGQPGGAPGGIQGPGRGGAVPGGVPAGTAGRGRGGL